MPDKREELHVDITGKLIQKTQSHLAYWDSIRSARPTGLTCHRTLSNDQSSSRELPPNSSGPNSVQTRSLRARIAKLVKTGLALRDPGSNTVLLLPIQDAMFREDLADIYGYKRALKQRENVVPRSDELEVEEGF